jgi:CHAD domain-containing protein
MSFEFKNGESVSHAVQRIAGHEIDTLLAQLRAGPSRRDAVHEARKSSKRLRALVRLVRDEIGEKRYRLENGGLRAAVRPLSSVRDAEALVHSLDLLAERFADDIRSRTFGRLRRVLAARMRALHTAPRTRMAMRHAAALVARARSRVAGWTIRNDGWSALDPGLHRIYARARAAGRCAAVDSSVEHLHEWRKRSKDLRYVLDLLRPVWPPVMKTFADQAHELTDRLGDDHDLSELQRFVLGQPASCGTSEDCAALVALIDVRRGELVAGARAIGVRLYVEKPRALVSRLRGYWAAWEGAGVEAPSRVQRPPAPARRAA